MKKLAAKLGVQAVPLLTLTLITHSLGNIVLEEPSRRRPPRLFGTVVLNSSATASGALAALLGERLRR